MTGLLTGLACMESGRDFRILTEELVPPPPWAVLHRRCGLPLKEHSLATLYYGTARGYAFNAYGNAETPTSFGKQQPTNVYSALEAYQILTGLLEPKIEFTKVRDFSNFRKEGLTISTIPLSSMYPDVAEYKIRYVTKREYKKPFGSWLYVYVGYVDYPYYRAIFIDNMFLRESAKPSSPDSIPVKKVLPLTQGLPAELLSLNVHLVGRYGAWDKTQHMHDGYYRTKEMLRSL